MATAKEMWEEEMAMLRTLRDEVKLKAHLFKADAKDEWAKVDSRVDAIEAELKRFRDEAREPVSEIGAAAKALFMEAKEALQRIAQKAGV